MTNHGQTATAKTKFQIWYERNQKKLSRKRRKRYRTDKAYRKKQLKSTKLWRERTREQRRKNRPPKTRFTVGEAAAKIGCYPRTIQNLERSGLLPVMTDGVKHRSYTVAQIELMGKLIDFRQKAHYKTKGYAATVRRLAAMIQRKWGNSGHKK
jgi:hypothetical protein